MNSVAVETEKFVVGAVGHPRDIRYLLSSELQGQEARIPQAVGHPDLSCFDYVPTAIQLPPFKLRAKPWNELRKIQINLELDRWLTEDVPA